MESQFNQKIRPILDTFDKLREILRFENIELPKIVVVGDQSSGKSSVLESITNIALPRGENTVTKCPIVIQIRNVISSEMECASVRIEGDKHEEKCSLEGLSLLIREKQSELISKANSEISDTPLYVNVKKINCPDLTLYDLPGITYKSENLTTKIREIIKKYTAGKETLILLVIPANTDLTTSEAIALIKNNQDFQERTIAIITKIDLAAGEKNLLDKLIHNELGLKHVPVVVRNRTQNELDEDENFSIVRQREDYLINNHKDLSRLPSESKGTTRLINKLIKLQKDKLISSKFDIKEKITIKMHQLEEEFEKMPLPAETLEEKRQRFYECLTIFLDRITQAISGNRIDINDKSNNICARIREQFEGFYKKFVREYDGYFFSENFHKKLVLLINETRGLKLGNFFDCSGIHCLIGDEIKKFNVRASDMLDVCKDLMLDFLLKIANTTFRPYPMLVKGIQTELKESINEQASNVSKIVQELIEAESNIEWTINPAYMDLVNKTFGEFQDALEKGKRSDLSNPFREFDELKLASEEFKTTLNSKISCLAYWTIFQNRFYDYYQLISAKKLISYYSSEIFRMDLEKKFAPSSEIERSYISEENSLTQRRHDVKESLSNLKLAKEELNNIL